MVSPFVKISTDDFHRRIDEDKASKAREEMIRKKVIYGHSVPYRNMCRFNSGVRTIPAKLQQEANGSLVLLPTPPPG